MLRETDMFDPACFLYASLSCISKAKTVKRTLLETDNVLQSSNKKATCLTRTQIIILGIFEKQRTKLDIFVNFLKKKHSFFISFYFFKEERCFGVELCIFFSTLPSFTNQQLSCVTERNIGPGPWNHTPQLYELLVSVR